MFLKNLWYFAGAGNALKPGQMQRHIIANEQVLVGRTHTGNLFALRDSCPHLGCPLSAGRLAMAPNESDSLIICRYHGWRYNAAGRCTHIPSRYNERDVEPTRIKVPSYDTREENGNIWVYIGEAHAKSPAPTTPPPIPADLRGKPAFQTRVMVKAGFDLCVIGMTDPTHTSHIHYAPWQFSERPLNFITRKACPEGTGYSIESHRPTRHFLPLGLLGRDLSCEIHFTLPGTRLDIMRTNRSSLAILTTLTPFDETTTEICHTVYSDKWAFDPLMILFHYLTRRALKQDKAVLEAQAEGLQYDPELLFVRDADEQARWYYELKDSWVTASQAGTSFENPIELKTLRWRS